MSIIEPKIDVLLDRTDNDRFLLCALASKRAHDINDMMRGQRDRAIQLQTAVEIARAADTKPLSMCGTHGLQRDRPRRGVLRSRVYRRYLPLANGFSSALRSPVAPNLDVSCPHRAPQVRHLEVSRVSLGHYGASL